jgi:hypothetical protein
MAGRTVNKAEQPTRPTRAQGFAPEASRSHPHPQAQSPGAGSAGAGQEQVHSAAISGLSQVVTHQVEQAAEMVSDAERFTADAARRLAKRSHRLASGRTFADHYVRELNALCEAEPFGGFGQFNWEQAHELLEDLGKPALPSPTPRFLPNA